MNEHELRDFKKNRQPSPANGHFDVSKLPCYGCAHSASGAEFPGDPSGERPCCSCVRNPEREAWAKDSKVSSASVAIDDHGHARDFDPFGGSLYNGAPTLFFPMDNYVTLDQRDQERWLDEHPEYAKPIRTNADGKVTIVE